MSIETVAWVAVFWGLFAVYIYLWVSRKMRVRELIAVFLNCLGGTLIITMGRSVGGNIGIAIFVLGTLLQIMNTLLTPKK